MAGAAATVLFLWAAFRLARRTAPTSGPVLIAATWIYATSLIGRLASTPRTSRMVGGWLFLVSALATAAAVNTVLTRSDAPVPAVFRESRLQRLTTTRPWVLPVVMRYERLVPPGSTVALAIRGNEFEYPFFGDGLVRRVIPVPSLARWRELQGRERIDFLVFDRLFHGCDGDDVLGSNYYLRDLRAGKSLPGGCWE